MARVLLIGGGACGRALAADLYGDGHAVRVVTRDAGLGDLQGPELWQGDPDRLATLRGSLDGVAVACWLLGHVSDERAAAALHGPRLEAWLLQCVDSTVRGIVYEACGTVAPDLLTAGAEMVRATCATHQIPCRVLEDLTVPADPALWRATARECVQSLLA